ncbi:RagB/SusD family nutrient uptake outer membrane protein [Niabella beijingensis]|uniref:RagB/SusD family nutrient uptake outer membrane protein n=1 Tax=Niabella beijingensis TaxID=2872700 RepID=UPI001CBDF7CB|nr:RagB/SusD family nutrient uptake outer membrane protein [Niabella beijingensis]MBZ4187304.1 RagB/SusD family nutrient uptake outer membrane protein [Niabella beijingensis]
MKRILLYICLVLLVTSCKKGFLDRDPLDAYNNDQLWKSENDVVAALNGCYNGWESAQNIYYMDCASDNAYGQYPWEGYTALGNGTVTPSDGDAATRWNFGVVQKCNWFLANIDQYPGTLERKDQYKSEARFLRAYQFFIMSQLYGDVPLVLKNITTDEANKMNRDKKADVVAFVLKELGEAAAALPATYDNASKGRITKGAALSLKARVELYNGNYQDAVTDYQAVMELGYKLYPSYADLFRIGNENNSEVILDVQYITDKYNNTQVGVMPSNGAGGWSSIDPLQELVDAYEMKNGKTITETGSGYNANNPYANRDPRLTTTIQCSGQPSYNGGFFNSLDAAIGGNANADYYLANNNTSPTGYVVRKYISNLAELGSDMWNTGLNVIVIRYAEVLLGYAEAKIELGQTDNSVYDAIDLVRQRAGLPKTDRAAYGSPAALRTLVRRERRVELAMEGLRFFDVQRWKIGPAVMNKAVYGTRPGSVNMTTGVITFSSANYTRVENRFFADKNYLWPIPQKDVDVHHDPSYQNPGY